MAGRGVRDLPLCEPFRFFVTNLFHFSQPSLQLHSLVNISDEHLSLEAGGTDKQ
jgi:hypothetical protein